LAKANLFFNAETGQRFLAKKQEPPCLCIENKNFTTVIKK